MKANRKFIRGEEAVSPVIAVILMVAITVVLAATVYVWVSGFSASGSQPAKTLSLSSGSALNDGHKNYTITAGTPGMKWSDLTFTVDGATFNMTAASTTGAANGPCPAAAEADGRFLACGGGNTESASATINAGDTIRLYNIAAGETLRILDTQANSVVMTLVIG